MEVHPADLGAAPVHQPGGWTMDQMAELKELFINNENFIQLCRLR